MIGSVVAFDVAVMFDDESVARAAVETVVEAAPNQTQLATVDIQLFFF